MYTAKTCRHIMPEGRTCKSPAMRGSAYCYYHGPQKPPRSVSKITEMEFEIDDLVEPSCVPIIGNQILRAMATNRLSSGRASVMLQTMQTVMAAWRMATNDALLNSGQYFALAPAGEPSDPPQSRLPAL
jgi:hypothetical protein